MKKIVVMLVSMQLFAQENLFYKASPELHAYVQRLAREMGIRQKISVRVYEANPWEAVPVKCIIKMPFNAGTTLLNSSKTYDYYLQRGLLMHELGHIKIDTQKLIMANGNKSVVVQSKQDERMADEAVLDEEEVLQALRDFFLQRSSYVTIQELENNREQEIEKDKVTCSTHSSDAVRALYFHQRLHLLLYTKQETLERITWLREYIGC